MAIDEDQGTEQAVEPEVTDEEPQATVGDVEDDVEAHGWRAQS
jgi:hypothetical protein